MFKRYIWDFSGDGTTTGTPEILDVSGNGRHLISRAETLNNTTFWSDESGAGTWGDGVFDAFTVETQYKQDFQPLLSGHTFVWLRCKVVSSGTYVILGTNAGTSPADADDESYLQIHLSGASFRGSVRQKASGTPVIAASTAAGADNAYHNHSFQYSAGDELSAALDGTVVVITDTGPNGTVFVEPGILGSENDHRLTLGARGDLNSYMDDIVISQIEWYHHSTIKPNFARLAEWKEEHPNMPISQGLWENGEDINLDSPKASLDIVRTWDFGRNKKADGSGGKKNAVVIRTDDELYNAFYSLPLHGTTPINGEWQRYKANTDTECVTYGKVHVLTDDSIQLTARLAPTMTVGNIISGILRSKEIFQRGYFEIRCKSPTGRGVWPAFWTISENDGIDEKWPPEIDFFEIVHAATQDTTHLHVGVIGPETTGHGYDEYTRVTDFSDYVPGYDFADDFHVIGCWWEMDRVSWYVDGVRICTKNWQGGWFHNAGSGGGDGGPGHLLVNLAIGDDGSWVGSPLDPNIFPCNLEVDYIQVWQ